MPDTVLKPCPFCGGLPDGPTFSAEMGEKDAYEVECQNCCFGLEGPAKRTTEAAIATWNTRTPSSATPEVSELVERLNQGVLIIGSGPGQQDMIDVVTANQAMRKAAIALETLEARVRVSEEALRDPAAVHVNMLRGGIAKPSVRNIWHLYGEEALLADAPEHIRALLKQLSGDENG